MPPWITAAQRDALATLLDALHDIGLPFQATGGLAGNLHGSQWPLHDLDFDVADAALPLLADRFREQVVAGPAPYRDTEFALELLTLRLGEVEADLVAAQSIRLIDAAGRERPAPTDLARVVLRPFDGREIPTMPLDTLIAYKRAIGRHADVADLERLQASGAQASGAPAPA